MSLNSDVDFKRLEKQLYLLSPSLHKCSEKGKGRIRKKLYDQLQTNEPKVALEKYHVHKLLVNIEKNFQKCKDFGIIETSKEAYEEVQKGDPLANVEPVHLSEQSDDDSVNPVAELGSPSDQSSRSLDKTVLPLIIRKESNERMHTRYAGNKDGLHSQNFYTISGRKRSHSILSNETTEHVKVNKYDNDTQVTLTISLPSILKESVDNSLEISVDFGKIDLARKVLNQRIRSISDNENKTSNSNSNCTVAIDQSTQKSQEEKNLIDNDEALSHLISEVLVEPNAAETMRATAALVNINNNVCENYNTNLSLNHAPLSVTTNASATSQRQEDGTKKKSRKRTKKEKNSLFPKSPPKKRGRKPRQKHNEHDTVIEKSDLAKYVELFSNNCELPCTAATTTLSSTMSQVAASTSNQNYENTNRNANENQTAQISYLINGEWTSGGICQLIPSSNVVNIGLDTGHIIQEDFSLNTPFEDFVNYIDSPNNDVGNNEIARVLDDNIAAPTTCATNVMDGTNIVSGQNRNINNYGRITSKISISNFKKSKETVPPPAHNIEGGILDLSLKTELFDSVIIEDECIQSDFCEPVDLSMKSNKEKSQLQDNPKYQILQGEEESDEVFIRRLIDDSGFDYKDDNCNQNCDATPHSDLLFEPMLDENGSFKAALDMPLLDNDLCTAAVKRNDIEFEDCDTLKKSSNDFTANPGGLSLVEIVMPSSLSGPGNMSIGELTQTSRSQDLTTPPPLTYIHKLDTTKEISRSLTEIGHEHLKLTEIVPLSVTESLNIANKIKENFNKPPVMSLISKSMEFSTNAEIISNDEASEKTSNTGNIDINTVENLINQCPQQSEVNNVDTNPDEESNVNNKEEDNDAGHLNKPQSIEILNDINSNIDNVDTLEKKSINIELGNDRDAYKENINEKLCSEIEDLETPHKNIFENFENHDSFLVDVQLETESDINKFQVVDNDSNTKCNSIDKESIQNANPMNLDNCNEKVEQPLERKIANSSEKEEPNKNNVSIFEVRAKSGNMGNDAMHYNQASEKVESSIETAFISIAESDFNNECSLPENKQRNIVDVNNIISSPTDTVKDTIEEISHNSAPDTVIKKTEDCLLQVTAEDNTPTTMIQESGDKENDKQVSESLDNIQMSSLNLSQSLKVVTHIDDVNLCFENKSIGTIANKKEKSENKESKGSSKLEIISVVAIDSFIHANEDDNEFIRRTLKSNASNPNIDKLTNSNLQLSESKDGSKTEEVILAKSKNCLKVEENGTQESTGIIKEELTHTAEDSNKITEDCVIVAVPKDDKLDVGIKSETVDENNANKILTNLEMTESLTKDFQLSSENKKFKNELKDEIEHSYYKLDELEEEKCDLSLGQKNKVIILSELPSIDKNNIEIKIDTKTMNTEDEITDLSVKKINLIENKVDNDNQTNESNMSSHYDRDHNYSSALIKKSSSIDVCDSYFALKCSTESNESNEAIKESKSRINSTKYDTEEKMSEEKNYRSTPKKELETYGSVEPTKEINLTAVSKNIKSYDEKNNLFSTNLSLLEMEKQFDDSLDFDNHLEDDVLSLATSCFNSPDDDRFDNFKMWEESSEVTDKKTILTNTTGDDFVLKPEFVEIRVQPQTTEERKEIEDKKQLVDPLSTSSKFIIPKLNTVKTPQFVQETNDSQPMKRIELDKIIRTVQNVCAVPPFPLQPPAISSVSNLNTLILRKNDIFSNSTENEISGVIPLDQKLECVSFASDVLTLDDQNYMNMSRGQFGGRGGEAMNRGAAIDDIAKIFGITCLPFLVDKCSVLPNAQHNHQLRNAGFVQVALEGLPKAELNSTYKFIFNHSKLFRRYFFVFCSVYAKQNNRSKLLSMVNDCEKHVGCVVLLRNIFYSLIECGLNKINACRQILSRSRDKSSGTIDVLVGIIFEADWSMFCDYLERFSQITHYSFRINLLSEMAGRVLRTKDNRLSSVVCKCLLTLNQDDYKLVSRTPNLIALLELMKDGKVC